MAILSLLRFGRKSSKHTQPSSPSFSDDAALDGNSYYVLPPIAVSRYSRSSPDLVMPSDLRDSDDPDRPFAVLAISSIPVGGKGSYAQTNVKELSTGARLSSEPATGGRAKSHYAPERNGFPRPSASLRRFSVHIPDTPRSTFSAAQSPSLPPVPGAVPFNAAQLKKRRKHVPKLNILIAWVFLKSRVSSILAECVSVSAVEKLVQARRALCAPSSSRSTWATKTHPPKTH